jgi:hypothetical protein
MKSLILVAASALRNMMTRRILMKHGLTLALLPMVLHTTAFAGPQKNRETAVIEKFIAKQATQETGEEYEEARKVVAGDLNHDGVADLAVVYTIEGQNATNNYIQYLAVFIRTRKGLVPVDHTSVGGKLNWDVDLKSIKRNVILLKTLTHLANDTAAMPTRKGTARFMLVNRRLKEL